MAQHSHVPKFGNWDAENVPYTAYFEHARRERGGIMMNPNDPMENPEAFNTCMRVGANVDADEVIASPGCSHNGSSLENGSCRVLGNHTVRRRSRRSNGGLTEEVGSEQNHFDRPVAQRSPHSDHKSGNPSFNDHANHGATAIPKFGAWDLTNPNSGEGYTIMFNRVKEERQIMLSHVSNSTPPLNNSNIKNHYGGSSSWLSKYCCCCFQAKVNERGI